MRFSLITPVYNRADYIRDCIQSVVDQMDNFTDFEHIIVDDGSTDNTLEIIRLYEKRCGFIKTISYEKNAGVNYARNRGIEKACGEFIIFLDSDDTLNSGILRTINEAILEDLHYNHFFFRVSSNKIENVSKREIGFKELLLEAVEGDFLHVVRASFLKEQLFFEQFRAFEVLNWLRVVQKTQPVLDIPIQAVSVRIGDNDSLSQRTYKSTNRNVLIENFKAKRMYLDMYGDELKKYSVKAFYKKVLLLFLTGARADLYAANTSLIKELTPYSSLQKVFLIFFNNRAFSFLVRKAYSFKYFIE